MIGKFMMGTVTIVIPQFLVDISKLLEGTMKGDILWDFMWFHHHQDFGVQQIGMEGSIFNHGFQSNLNINWLVANMLDSKPISGGSRYDAQPWPSENLSTKILGPWCNAPTIFYKSKTAPSIWYGPRMSMVCCGFGDGAGKMWVWRNLLLASTVGCHLL